MAPPRILLFAGSTTPAAPASRLAAAFQRELVFLDAEATLIALADYPLPLHDASMSSPLPETAEKLRRLARGHAALFIASPTVLGGVPALLRNVIEWLRADSAATRAAPLVALSATADDEASAGATLSDLERIMGRGFGATLIGGGLALGRAALSFDAKGRLDDPAAAAALQALARETVLAAARLAPEP